MTLTPKNLSTTDFLAFCAAPVTAKPLASGELRVKVYDYKAWTWDEATDAELIAAVLGAATIPVYATVGQRVFVGNVLGKRVCVEVR